MTCRQCYEERLEARETSLKELRRDDDRAANFRVAAFLGGIACAWLVFGSWQFSLWLLLLPIALFVTAVFFHERVRRRILDVERSIAFYQQCLRRLDGDWSGFGQTGEEYLLSEHHYAGDLDIFGPGSLYQLLSSPVTPTGSQTLAHWLAPTEAQPLAPTEVILRRQAAVRNLKDQLNLREDLAVIGNPPPSQGDVTEIHSWFGESGGLNVVWIRVVGFLLGVLGMASLIIWLSGYTAAPLLITVLMQMAYVYCLRQPLGSIKKHSAKAVDELRRVVRILTVLETVEGEDDELKRLRGELHYDGSCASKTIRELERHVSQFENMRRNLFFAPLAFLSMTLMHFACAIDRWRDRHGKHVGSWLQAAGDLEALLAFAQLHFENPSYSFPSLLAEGPCFQATQVAHPLLAPGTAIANDIALTDDCRMLLVSGSNMSGKSTLMRSVGINAVLAWAGAPVYADKLALSRLQVAAAMRMQDSLQTGTSHFYAELKRIRIVVELAEQAQDGAPPVLFLLDEILHGTNSHDRLIGARGVIRNLLQADAIGLVSTHDLALSDMIGELSQPARNVHFCDEWRDGKMAFDYRMREGVVPKSNALSLMRLLGLDV